MKKIGITLLVSILLLSACIPQNTVAPEAAQIPEVESQDPDSNNQSETQEDPVDSSTPITVIDALGREVTFEQPPQRIVFTGKALFMVVDAAYMFPEAPDRIAALGNTNQGSNNFIALIDPDYKSKNTLQQDAAAEQIAASKPDLVILKSYLADTVGKPIEALNIPVIYVDFETPEQYSRDLVILGKIFQNESRAKELVEYFQNKVDFTVTTLQPATDKPSVLMLYYSDKDGVVAFNVPPLEWIQTQMVQLAGGDPVWSSANPTKGWTKVSLDQIAAWDADHIFIIAYTTDSSEVVDELKNDVQWQALRSVKEGQLYAFPGDFYSWDQADPRWILGLTSLAKTLHPDAFPRLIITDEAMEFYQLLYGLDANFFEENILPTIKGDLP